MTPGLATLMQEGVRLEDAPTGMGICPACSGTKRQPVDATGKPVGQSTEYPRWPQYAERGWMECRDCGGQTMSDTGTGFSLIDPSTGEGCMHTYRGQNAGRCYTVHTCAKCGDSYGIDSSD